MAIIPAVVTDDARKYWPQFLGGILGTPGSTTVPGTPPTTWDPRFKFFKVGEGGWVDPGGGKVRRTPVSTLRRLSAPLIQDIDAAVDPTRAAPDQRYLSSERVTFKKDLVFSDVSFIAPSTIQIECLLDFSEFNDDGFGNSPEMYEIGIFSDHPEEGGLASDQGLMVAYGTFPVEVKDVTKQILNLVRIIF
jgi:hypothetical protein